MFLKQSSLNMRYLNKSFLALLCAAGLLGACDTEDTYDVLDIEVPAGYELSAGTSTLFVRSSKAYERMTCRPRG